jgi:NAD+ kinase
MVPPGFDEDMAFAIVLGGDGTVLSACRQLAPAGIPILTINTGHMGFLTETYLNQLPEALSALMEGSLHRRRSRDADGAGDSQRHSVMGGAFPQ